MNPDIIVKRVLLVTVLFFCGGWLFNHFPYPIVGIFVAVAYPLFLLYRKLKNLKGNQIED